MLTPISDDNSDRIRTPFVNYLLIAINVLVFIFLQQGGADIAFTYAYSTVPAEILTGRDIVTEGQTLQDAITGQVWEIPGLQPTPIPVYFTIITSMFMHGGWGHLIGNMLYLYIFGDNLENRMGHGKYLAFYLVVGIIATLSHVFASFLMPNTHLIPSLGASGAISGVLGGNLLLFPHRRVHALLGIFIVQVPVIVALGLWILFQVVSGLGMLGGESDGVAYAAHIGGFLAGLILVKLFDGGKDDGIDPYRTRLVRRRR
jgi:membrane associated rhomboid family serine protease